MDNIIRLSNYFNHWKNSEFIKVIKWAKDHTNISETEIFDPSKNPLLLDIFHYHHEYRNKIINHDQEIIHVFFTTLYKNGNYNLRVIIFNIIIRLNHPKSSFIFNDLISHFIKNYKNNEPVGTNPISMFLFEYNYALFQKLYPKLLDSNIINPKNNMTLIDQMAYNVSFNNKTLEYSKILSEIYYHQNDLYIKDQIVDFLMKKIVKNNETINLLIEEDHYIGLLIVDYIKSTAHTNNWLFFYQNKKLKKIIKETHKDEIQQSRLLAVCGNYKQNQFTPLNSDTTEFILSNNSFYESFEKFFNLNSKTFIESVLGTIKKKKEVSVDYILILQKFIKFIKKDKLNYQATCEIIQHDSFESLFQNELIFSVFKILQFNEQQCLDFLNNSSKEDSFQYYSFINDSFNQLSLIQSNNLLQSFRKNTKYKDINSVYKLHEAVSIFYRKIKTPLIDLQIKEHSPKIFNLDKLKIGNFTIEIPKTNHDLIYLGESMHNCVGSYVSKVRSMHSSVIAISHLNQMEYCIEIVDNEITQFVGQYNAPVSKEMKKPIIDFFKKKKIIN